MTPPTGTTIGRVAYCFVRVSPVLLPVRGALESIQNKNNEKFGRKFIQFRSSKNEHAGSNQDSGQTVNWYGGPGVNQHSL